LRELFDALDTNRDGEVSHQEISVLTSDRAARAATPLRWDTLLAQTMEDAVIGREPFEYYRLFRLAKSVVEGALTREEARSQFMEYARDYRRKALLKTGEKGERLVFPDLLKAHHAAALEDPAWSKL